MSGMLRHYEYSDDRAQALKLATQAQKCFDPVLRLGLLKEAVSLGDADSCLLMAPLLTGSERISILEKAAELGNDDVVCMLMDIGIDEKWPWRKLKRYLDRVDQMAYCDIESRKSHKRRARLFLQLAQYGFPDKELCDVISTCHKAADDNQSDAQNTMARLANSGWIDDDPLEWYRKAAENGNADAMVNYADSLQSKPWLTDDVKSYFQDDFEWMRKAAELGNPSAAFNLASYYYLGYPPCRKDPVKALFYYRSAAEQNNIPALLYVADMTARGLGCEPSMVESAKALERAAELGDGNACLALSLRYLLGSGGCVQDEKKAGYWLLTGFKIVKTDWRDDYRLRLNLSRVIGFGDRWTSSLRYFDSQPFDLWEHIKSTAVDLREKLKTANDDPDGIVVNLHFVGLCNFHCRTCYFPRDEFRLSIDTWMMIVDQLVSTYRIKRFNFAGGEPLLMSSDKFLQPLIDHIRQYDIEVSIITNGYLLTPDFILSNKGKIKTIGISVDGIDEKMNQLIGRATEDGRVLENTRLFDLADTIHAAGMELKINTQVMKPSLDKDFHEIIKRMRPNRWKLLQTSIRQDANVDAADWVVTSEEFDFFVKRHQDLNPIVEPKEKITNAYYMIFQYGEFVYVEGDEHRHLPPLIWGMAEDSINKLPHNKSGYNDRYSGGLKSCPCCQTPDPSSLLS